MPRDIIVLFDDIISSVDEIFLFLHDVVDLQQYKKDILRKRAVERNLEIIGRDARNIVKIILQ